MFGHFGVSFPAALQTTGMVLFITSVGVSAGPSFVGNLRRHGAAYVLLCLFTAVSGSLVCVAVIRLAGVETPLAMGLMTARTPPRRALPPPRRPSTAAPRPWLW